MLRSVRLLCGPGGRGGLCVGGGGGGCSGARSRVVAKLLHVFGHDVEGDGDEALGLNTSHCKRTKHRGTLSLVAKIPCGKR